MDTIMKDMNGTQLLKGDTVATAMVSRSAGSGLRQGTVASLAKIHNLILVKMNDSGREVARRPSELVKVAQ